MRHEIAIAVISDLHIGSTVALFPERYVTPDGQTLYASPAQRWILGNWNRYWAEFHSIKAKKKSIIVNGEFCEGVHHNITQIAGTAELMEEIAVSMLKPHVAKVDALFVVKGSEAHSKPGGTSDEAVARELGAKPCTGTGARASYHWRINAGGVFLDCTHHITGSGTPWTRGNNLRRVVLEHLFGTFERNERPANILIRSHVHGYNTWEQNGCRAYVTPSWKLSDAHAHKVAPGNILPIGGLIIKISKGRGDVEPRLFYPVKSRQGIL